MIRLLVPCHVTGERALRLLGRIISRLATAVALIILASCTLVSETLKTGGEKQLTRTPVPKKIESPPARVIVLALDGATPTQLMAAINSGHAPHLQALLGAPQSDGLYEHAYAAPHAMSMLPSSTVADWSAIFTGTTPANNGVPGDEWFERDNNKFLAPVPI